MKLSRPNKNTFIINGMEIAYIMTKDGKMIYPDQLDEDIEITDYDSGNGSKNVIKGSVIKTGKDFRLGDG